jgi:pimeloyl-ACP methyl ester carboxylesterase
VRHDGRFQFRWRECGAGEPVLLLHGLMGEVDHWEATLETLGSFCRPVALELPIFDPCLSEISLPSLGEWARMFLNAQRIPHAVVGGNSLGGHVALELALAHPDRVSGLILTGSSGLLERSFTRGVPHRPNSQWVREKMQEVFYDPALVTSERVEEVLRVVSTRDSALRVLQAARASKHRNMEDCLPTINIPTCIIWGEEDRITPPEVARRFHALLPDSDLFLVPRCGHAPMLEQPEAFNAILAGWLLQRTLCREQPALLGGAAA